MGNEGQLSLRGPLTLLGVVAGLLTGGVILPDGCGFNVAQAERLHVVLPLAMPLALWLMFTWTRKYRDQGPLAPRHTWLWLAAADLVLAEALFLLVAAIAYSPGKWLFNFAAGWLFFAPILVGVLLFGVAIVGRARSASAVRPGSLARGLAERQVWLVALLGVGVLDAVIFRLHGDGFVPLLWAAFVVEFAALGTAVGFCVLDARTALRLQRVLDDPARYAGRASLRAKIDLGLGDELRERPAQVGGPYRTPARPSPTVIGAPLAVARKIARARALDGLVVVALLACLGWSVVCLSQAGRAGPAPSTPSLAFPFWHC